MLEVWDAGKGTICRVYFDIREEITEFHLERLIDRNFLFVCLTNMMRCYEIGSDGETCDHVMDVNLVLPGNPTAIGLYLGSDALYLNMNNRQLFQVTILNDLIHNDKSEFYVLERNLCDYMAFDLGENKEVFKITEL